MKIAGERVVLGVLTIIFLYLVHGYISDMKSLPSPLYGGDYYYQLGQIYHMYESPLMEWMGDSNGLGELNIYFFTYGALVTVFGRVFGFEPMAAMFAINYLLIPLSVLLIFGLYRLVSGSERMALFGLIFTLSYTAFPILKYTDFTKYVIVPAFLVVLFLFFRKQGMKESLLLGATYGLIGLSHSTSFVFSTLTMGIFFVYMLWSRKSNERIALLKPMVLAFLLGFLLAQLYWFKPIFVYHGQSAQAVHLWTTPDYGNNEIALKKGIEMLWSHFFNTQSIFGLIKSLLAAYGAYFLFVRKKWRENAFATLVFISAFLLTYSYFITMPLLGTHFVPNYCSSMYLSFGAVLLALVGFENIVNRYGKQRTIIYAVVALLFVLSMYGSYNDWYNNRWADAGRNPLPAYMISVQEYLLENTAINDVVLSTNEVSFALNSLSGRKLVISRRSQNDAFMGDFDERQMDAAVIFYGDDIPKKWELLKKYNVSYFYWDAYWINSEYQFNEQGQLVNIYDPLLVPDTEENRVYLGDNGIKYQAMNFWLDPAIRSDEIRKFDILLISPENYNSFEHPWNYDVDPYLEKVWEYKENGISYAVLYRVNIP